MRISLRYAALIPILAAAAALAQSGPSHKFNPQEQFQPIPFPVVNSPLNPYAGSWLTGSTYGQGITVFYASQVWQSQIPNNQGNTPSASSTAWKAITPSLGGAAAGTQVGAAQTTDGNGRFIADPLTTIVNGTLQTLVAIAKGPRVNPAHTDFAGGISESNTDVQNCAAFRAAVAYAGTLAAQGEMATMQIPKGTYSSSCGLGRIGTNGDSTRMINILGDAQNGTEIINTSSTGNGLTINRPLSSVSYQQAVIANLTISGKDAATSGTLIENSGGGNITYQNVTLRNNAGRGFLLLNGAERNYCLQCTVTQVRFPITISGDINESFFSELQMLDIGVVAQGGLPNNIYTYNLNSVNGLYPTSGTLYPDHHAGFVCEGNENVVIGIGGSTKSTHNLGGYKFDGCSLVNLNDQYIESGSSNTLTHDVQIGGAKELSVTTAAMTTTSLIVPVTNTAWQPHYLTAGADADAETYAHALTAQYLIMPPDHILGSTAASSLGNGITKGTVELVQLGAFAGDGSAHLIARGVQGDPPTVADVPGPAIAWPAGAVLTGVPGQMLSSINLNSDHMNTMNAVDTSHTSGCSDAYNGPGSPNRTCGSVIVGFLADGYTVTSSNVNNLPTPLVAINHPTLFTTSDYTFASGVVKVVSQAHLEMTAVPEQIRSYASFGASAFYPAAGVNSAYNTFNYGNVSVHAVYYPDSGQTAHVAFREPNSGTWIDGFNGFFLSQFHAGLDSNGEMPGLAWTKGFLMRDIGPNGFPTFEKETLGYPYSSVGEKWCVWYGATGGATPTSGTKSCPVSILMDTTTGNVTTTGFTSSGGGAPNGAAGGDLNGTYPNPSVGKVNGGSLPVSALSLATNASGQIVAGTNAPTGAAGGDLNGTYPNPSVTKINGVAPAPSATTDTTNASNITSGTLGTGVSVPASDLASLPVSASVLATNSSGKIIAGTPSSSSPPTPYTIASSATPVINPTNGATAGGMSIQVLNLSSNATASFTGGALGYRLQLYVCNPSSNSTAYSFVPPAALRSAMTTTPPIGTCNVQEFVAGLSTSVMHAIGIGVNSAQ